MSSSNIFGLMIPGDTVIGYGSKRKVGKNPTKESRNVLRDLLTSSEYPLHGLSLSELESLFSADGSIGFKARAVHNAYAMLKEEKIANSFATGSDGFISYLQNRWEESPYWLKRLDIVFRVVNDGAWVQESHLQVLR